MQTRRANSSSSWYRAGRFAALLRFVPCGVALTLLACSPRAAPAATPPPNESQNIAQPAMPSRNRSLPRHRRRRRRAEQRPALRCRRATAELDLHWPDGRVHAERKPKAPRSINSPSGSRLRHARQLTSSLMAMR